MSKLTDYSKFDHIDSGSEEGKDDADTCVTSDSQPNKAVAADADTPTHVRGTTKKHPSFPDRYIFSYNDQKVYEWEQSLDEVTIYIDAPMQQLPEQNTASFIIVNILPNQIQVGLKGGNRYFIDEKTFDKVKVKESSWYLDEGVITIVLSKCFRGQTWEGVLCGHASTVDGGDDALGRKGIQESIDPFTKQDMQRTLILERFQEENPGFDFRDATFNGEVPDPRAFMGGIGYNN